ncbi:acyl-[acyl-carrier-protein]--UDP-N-acetylglucosamine O-acyltransferase [Luteimonas sp. J16]|jgi:UDP-N-acetylglucosamine acyltransferase|uniref:acyl-ACP--UDP-N-acetylglucosamine O-acyltransferase n=1 Tax=unclassified Luteimonas TaxID=2629088 RepID=UPI00047A153D|nr:MULTISPECIES: acyl-ACP--UDP-N-acetylglucosamine O-acyltransferase [unclassified Luteimonas]TWG91219.1 acyl-[acyl-carrier-protein]--UDP-N-acetylglucosamine O-acyltransferase [Luteimonas sp. J16]
MAADIHPTAVVDPSARLGEGVSVGAFTWIGPGVEIGDGTRIGPHCSVHGPTRIGRDNRIVGHAAIGGDPQDKKYRGETVSLEIGDRNLVREFVTFNRGTGDGGGVTRIGSDNWFLAYTHVAHDCVVGNHCVFSNNASLAGHVHVGDHVILSGFAGVHQFCRIGAHAFIGMGAFVNGDVPPFLMVAQDKYARPRGINAEGLKRRGFDPARIAAIRRAYRALYLGDAKLEEARAELAEIAASGSEDVRAMLDFIEHGERPLLR